MNMARILCVDKKLRTKAKYCKIQSAWKNSQESNISYLLIRKCKYDYHEVTTVTFREDDPKTKTVPKISTQNAIKEEPF